ncbi:MAG: ribonuclease III [Candidatus Schekmanbacteria bacterium]|nr:ribonuclease III [Candidatus Schekmanbacteria bacterium]
MIDETRREKLSTLQEKIAYTFNDLTLLDRALTHRSYANEQRGEQLEDNERLEFLGDAVLELVISHHMVEVYPHYTEGDLSKLRSYIVSEPVLAEIARNLELGEYILLGKGEELTYGRHKNSLLANTFEAIIAGIYLDSDLDAARRFVIPLFDKSIHEASQSEHLQNFKSLLQEYTQAKLSSIPMYEVISKKGPHHQRIFEVHVKIGKKVYGQGQGKSKKEAEQQAAKNVLKILQENNGLSEAEEVNTPAISETI